MYFKGIKTEWGLEGYLEGAKSIRVSNTKVEKILLPFPSTNLCEVGFSALMLITKKKKAAQ